MIYIDFNHVYSLKGNSLCFQFIIDIIPLIISSIKDGNRKLLLKRLIEVKETY